MKLQLQSKLETIMRAVESNGAAAVGLILVIAWHWTFAKWGLRSGFTLDDLLGMHWGLTTPIIDQIRQTLFIWEPSPIYRPLGSLFYRAILANFGWNSEAFRVAIHALLIANIVLVFRAAQLLGLSLGGALLTALLFSHHSRNLGFYYNTGFCYDILCLFFYFSALVWYLCIRDRDQTPAWWQTIIWMALFAFALSSKEMAVSLPVVIAAYEIFAKQDRHWTEVGLGAVMASGFVVGRVLSRDGLSSIGAYTPHYSPFVYLETSYRYLGDVFYNAQWFTRPVAIAAILSCIAVAALAKQAAPRVAFVLMIAGILPIAFIPQRGLEQACIPWVGFLILVAWTVMRATRRIPWPFTIGAIGFLLFPVHWHHMPEPSILQAEGRYIRSIANQILELRPSMPKGGRILFLKDPFTWVPSYGSLFMIREIYLDPSLVVSRCDLPEAGFPDSFDAVFTVENGVVYDRGRGSGISCGAE